MLCHGLAQIDCAAEIDLEIQIGFANTFGDGFQARKMDNRIDGMTLEHAAQGLFAAIAEAVDDDHLVAGLQQLDAGVGANVTGAACNQDGFQLLQSFAVIPCEFIRWLKPIKSISRRRWRSSSNWSSGADSMSVLRGVEDLKAFEAGVKLTRDCQKALQDAEQKVEVLMRQNDETIAEPLDDQSPEGEDSDAA